MRDVTAAVCYSLSVSSGNLAFTFLSSVRKTSLSSSLEDFRCRDYTLGSIFTIEEAYATLHLKDFSLEYFPLVLFDIRILAENVLKR